MSRRHYNDYVVVFDNSGQDIINQLASIRNVWCVWWDSHAPQLTRPYIQNRILLFWMYGLEIWLTWPLGVPSDPQSQASVATPSSMRACPNGSFGWFVARKSEVLGSNSKRAGCISSGLCIFSAPNGSKHWSVQCVYGIVHCKEPLQSFDKSRTKSRLRASFCRDIAMIVQKAT